jgi:hypothetical protein
MLTFESQNVELVKGAYAAFSRGDILGLPSDAQSDWPAVEGIPHSGPRRGRQEVAQFFDTLLLSRRRGRIQQQDFIAEGGRVVVWGTYRARAKATGPRRPSKPTARRTRVLSPMRRQVELCAPQSVDVRAAVIHSRAVRP